MGLAELLELQREVRRACREVCFDAPVTGLDGNRAETILHEFDVDELRWMVDYYFSCHFPFPRGLLLDDKDREHYSRVIRNVGDVEEVNRFLFLEQKPMVLRLLADFVKRYNEWSGVSSLSLERGEFERDVAEKGLVLYLQQKIFSQRVIEESLHQGGDAVLEIARGQRNADLAYDEKTRAFTRVRNYEKSAARSVARFKRALADEYLREYPELEEYYDVPGSIRDKFLQVLKKVYMVKAFQGGFEKLEDVFAGFDLELYLSGTGSRLHSHHALNGVREIEKLYGEELALCFHEADFHNLSLLLQEKLENDMYQQRARPVFISGNPFGMEQWRCVADLHEKFYLGKDSWRRRLRKGKLKGVKEAVGKYVAEPKAGRWRVNPRSVERFKEQYTCDGILLIARNLEHLSRILHDDCYTLPGATCLDGLPSLDALKKIVKEEKFGMMALVGVPYQMRDAYGKEKPTIAVRGRRILTGRDVLRIRGCIKK